MSGNSGGRSFFCDFNAGGAALPEVVAAFLAAEQQGLANPASAHRAGRRARAVLEEARGRIAAVFGLEPTDVVFPSGGTEAANLAVLGLGDPELPVQLSLAEHPAVLEPAAQRGARYWPLDPTGAALLHTPVEPVGLMCLVHAQSELGTLQPVLAAAELAAAAGVPLFVDAAQSFGRVDVSPIAAVGAVVGLSPHKFGGLRGLGVLLGRGLVGRLRPLLRGGGQEFGLRPGTQSPALAIANAEAIERAAREQDQRAARMAAQRDSFLDGLASTGVPYRLLTPLANSVPNTIMLHFPGVDGRSMLPALDLANVHASHGAACSSGAPTPPRVLRGIGMEEDAARAAVRFSFGWSGSDADARAAGNRCGATIAALRKKI